MEYFLCHFITSCLERVRSPRLEARNSESDLRRSDEVVVIIAGICTPYVVDRMYVSVLTSRDFRPDLNL